MISLKEFFNKLIIKHDKCPLCNTSYLPTDISFNKDCRSTIVYSLKCTKCTHIIDVNRDGDIISGNDINYKTFTKDLTRVIEKVSRSVYDHFAYHIIGHGIEGAVESYLRDYVECDYNSISGIECDYETLFKFYGVGYYPGKLVIRFKLIDVDACSGRISVGVDSICYDRTIVVCPQDMIELFESSTGKQLTFIDIMYIAIKKDSAYITSDDIKELISMILEVER